MQNRTFRLFVSSTFSDFNEERKILQTKVFPEIKRYCASKKLNFQPIDLRWGVSAEAQLDQKTLELCLNEVQSSKINPHPNFLIMAGDRYGWIPLPYVIEKNEYKNILQLVENNEDKELLNSWYKLDENQIPASYILTERKNEYEKYEAWEKIETKLRDILQRVVLKTNIKEKNKNKYFQSATEAEVIEGIFKYLDKTPFQNKLLEKDKNLEKIDYENVYAYIRKIESFDDETLKDKFVDSDLSKVNNFKNEIKKSIDNKNILKSNANLINISQNEKNGSLNYKYETIKYEESIFEKTMIEYLKSSIDKYVKTKDMTSEELEKLEQLRFKNDKLKDFIEGSRIKVLETIDNYIASNENQSLVVYGKSGLGKSSLMAKAIENAEDRYKDSKKIIYRFVGSTANLTNTPLILISILKELGINEEIRKVKNPQTMEEEPEKIEDFYFRVHEHLNFISQDTIIFLDAVDQLSNNDEFLWLPNKLVNNLKIIITALEDENYKEDSAYFTDLKSKTTNIYPLEEFEENDAEKLIQNILERYDRTITQTQMDYLLNIYNNIKTPLYLSVAAQELRHWKSNDNSQALATSQKEIIEEFIENLTKLYHHDKEFIKRVFSYLYLSDGLSESELLEILSSDEEFLYKMAPDTYHKNETNELPVVIWARLHSQIKEFLKLENKDNAETISFFHREFNYVFKNQKDKKVIPEKLLTFQKNKEIHEQLIELLQKLIVKHQNEEFDSNRWGILYVEIVKNYHLKYEFEYLPNPNSKLYKWIFTVSALNNNYTKDLMIYCNGSLVDSQSSNKTIDMNIFTKMFYFVSKSLYIQDKKKWEEYYLNSLIALSSSLKSVELVNDAIKLEKESLEILEKLYIQNNEKWLVSYTINLNVLGNSYYKKNDFKEAIKYIEGYVGIVKEQYLIDKKTWSDKYTLGLINLASCFKSNRQIDEAIKLEKKSLEILEKLCINDKHESNEIYISNLNNLASSFYEKYHDIPLENKYFYEAVNYSKKAKEILEKAYEKDKNKWVESYTNNLNNLASIYKEYDRYQKSEEYFQEIINLENKCYDIRKSCYEENNERWANDYIIILNNLADFWRHRDLNKSIEYAKEALGILEKLYEQDKERWAEDYIRSLNNFVLSLKSTGEIEESIKYSKELLTTLEKLYNQDKEKWTENYTKNLMNLFLILNKSASSLELTGKIEESIKYFKEALLILEKLYEQDNERWAEDYQTSLIALVLTLNNFASNLVSDGRIEESIKYFIDELEILEKLFEQDKEKWVEDYSKRLNNLASIYAHLKLFNESSKLFEKSYAIRNFEEYNDIRYFIVTWIKWYQSENYLNNKIKIKELQKLALESIDFYKKKLKSSHLIEIEKIFVEYEKYAKNSKNNFEKEKFEIFKRFFYNDKI